MDKYRCSCCGFPKFSSFIQWDSKQGVKRYYALRYIDVKREGLNFVASTWFHKWMAINCQMGTSSQILVIEKSTAKFLLLIIWQNFRNIKENHHTSSQIFQWLIKQPISPKVKGLNKTIKLKVRTLINNTETVLCLSARKI